MWLHYRSLKVVEFMMELYYRNFKKGEGVMEASLLGLLYLCKLVSGEYHKH